MRIILLHPTLRVEVFKHNEKVWQQRRARVSGVEGTSWTNVVTYVGVNTLEEAKLLEKYNSIVTRPKGIGVCEPLQKMVDHLRDYIKDDDIIVVKSDDFLPPESWDTYLIEKLEGKSGVLMVRDGYQKPDSSNMQEPCVTIPILTGSALKKLNYKIYPTAYHHMFSDCELYLNAKELGILIDDRLEDTTMFEHLHWAAGKRKNDVVDQGYNAYWRDDEYVWNWRKKMSVDERIKD